MTSNSSRDHRNSKNQPHSSNESGDHVSQNRSILVVDDEVEFRDVIAHWLEVYSYITARASGGIEALEIVKSQKFDAVVTDLRMPKGDGISLLKNLQKLPSSPKVIVMTGYSDFDVEALKKLGAQEVLHKPFKMKELIRAISDCMG